MTLERVLRNKQKTYNNDLISAIMNSDEPGKVLRMFRYRRIMEAHGVITKVSLLKEFGKITERTAKVYLSELEPVNKKKPRSYKLPHRSKLVIAVIEKLSI